MVNVLLTGGNGFLGKSVVNLLAQESYNVNLHATSRSAGSDHITLDISKRENFSGLENNFYDVIIHCASVLPGGSFLNEEHLNDLYTANILGAQNLCNWAITQESVQRIINCSTLSVVSKPWPVDMKEDEMTYPLGSSVLYSSSKLVQELILTTFGHAHDKSIVHVRMSALYGIGMKWGGVLCRFIDNAINDKKISMTNGNLVNADFLNVVDAAKILAGLIENKYTGILNASSGREVSLYQLAEIISNGLTYEVSIENSDNIPEASRAKINTDNLNNVINTESFISLEKGISDLIRSKNSAS